MGMIFIKNNGYYIYFIAIFVVGLAIGIGITGSSSYFSGTFASDGYLNQSYTHANR